MGGGASKRVSPEVLVPTPKGVKKYNSEPAHLHLSDKHVPVSTHCRESPVVTKAKSLRIDKDTSPVGGRPNESSEPGKPTNILASKVSKLLSPSARSKWKPLLIRLGVDLPEWGTLLKGAQLSVKNVCKSKMADSDKNKSVVDFLKSVINVLDKPILECLKKLDKQAAEHAGEYDDEPGMPEFGKRLKTTLLASAQPQTPDDRCTLLDTIASVRQAVMSTQSLSVSPSAYHTKAMNSVVRNLGSALLDKSRRAKARLADFDRFDDIFLGKEIALLDQPFLLDYISKGIFVFLWAQRLKPLPVDLVIDRDAAFAGMVTALQDHERPLLARKDSEQKILTFRAYFRSEYGAKEVRGEKVEEGEGYGPRKEFFGLASRQLKRRYGPPRPGAGHAYVSEGDSKVKIKARPGAGVLTLPARGTQLCFQPKDGRDMGLDGEVSVLDVTRRGDDHGVVRTDHIFIRSAKRLPYVVRKRQRQLFTYHQHTESFWFNAELEKSRQDVLQYVAVGRMLATAITDRCTIDLPLALPVFQHLLQGASFRPSMADLQAFDADTHAMALRIGDMGDKEFGQVLEAEGSDPNTSKKAYVQEMVHTLLYADVSWQAQALRQGFNAGTRGEWWEKMAFAPTDLQLLVCGVNMQEDNMPDFRTLFRVHEDPELVQHTQLRECLWAVVDGLSPERMRLLLKFVTGVARLPIPGTEAVKVEMPFIAYGRDEHVKNLERLPQAHTCDNILELPNYWESLVEVSDGDVDEATLQAKLKEHLETKLVCAIQNSEGFGLDHF